MSKSGDQSPNDPFEENESVEEEVMEEEELEESDAGSESDSSEKSEKVEHKKRKRPKVNVKNLFDAEAELSGEDDSGDESEGDDNKDDYEYDGFVVQDDGEDSRRSKKKDKKNRKKKKAKRIVVDEEDLDLVRENLQKDMQTKDVGNLTFDDDEDVIDPERDDDESVDDFIDHGDDHDPDQHVYSNKRPVADKTANTYTNHQLQDALEIFGEDYLIEAGEGEEEQYISNIQPQRQTTTSIEFVDALESFLLPEDTKIVETDIPERFQSYITPADKRCYRWRTLNDEGANTISEDERTAEARWIASKIVDNCGLVTSLSELPHGELVNSIVNILKMIQEENLEVPFIWLYRRDKIHRSFVRENIWQTLQLDIQWCRLQYDIQVISSFLEQLGQTLNETYPPDVAEKMLNVKHYLDLLDSTTDEDEIRDIRRFVTLIDSGIEKANNGGHDSSGTAGVEEEEMDIFDDDYDKVRKSQGQVAGKDSNRSKKLTRNIYARYMKLEGVRKFISFFTVPVHEIGSAVHYEFQVSHPPTRSVNLVESATEVMDGDKIRSVSQLTKAVEQLVATELSMEPSIRKKCREVFRSGGNISSEVTAKGKQVITSPYNKYFGVHVIENKPIKEFFSRKGLLLFMKMLEAEQLGYIKISINSPQLNDFMIHFGKFLHSLRDVDDEFYDYRIEWDQLRLKIIQTAIEKFLMPSLVTETRAELTRLGKDAIIEEAATEFEERLKVGPFLPMYESEFDSLKAILSNAPNRPRAKSVAGFFFSQDRQVALHMACVDEDGCLKAHREIPARAMAQKKDKVESFLYENRPELIIINSAAGVNAQSLQTLIEKEIISAINDALRLQYDFNKRRDDYDQNSDNEEDKLPTYYPKIMIGDDSLASNFKVSKRAKKLLPTLSHPDAAAAVSLARFAVEPLAEYANLWMTADSVSRLFGYEAFFMNLHPLQKQLAGYQAKFVRALEFKLVDAISDVGVDIRKVCKHNHLAPMLAFIPGLGLRKADALRREIIAKEADHQNRKGEDDDEQGILLESRRAIPANKLLGDVVYNNAAGFLRIPESELISNWNPLDDTRIHPECYDDHDFVAKICFSALESDFDPTRAKEIISKLIDKLRRGFGRQLDRDPEIVQIFRRGKPDVTQTVVLPGDITLTVVDRALNDCLAELDLIDFNRSLIDDGYGDRLLQLEQIKEELRFPWLDLRWPYKGISSDKFFEVISGETEETLHIGRKVGYTVIRHPSSNTEAPKSVIVKTENNMKAYISKYEISDDRLEYGFDITKALPVGAEGTAVVVGIRKDSTIVEGVRKDSFHLQLSIKPSYVNGQETWWFRNWHEDKNATRYWADRFFNGDVDRRYVVTDLYHVLFDSHFNVDKALNMIDEADAAVTRQALSRQLASMGSNNKNSASGGGNGAPVRNVRNTFMIVHHLFANVDAKGAEERLRRDGHGAGAVLFRPSSGGNDQLTITWQFQEGVFKHIHVKQGPSTAGPTKISDQLFIMEDDMEEKRFYDIDDIQANYIEHLNDLVQKMVNYGKFLRGSPQEVEAILQNQANAKQGIIPYCIRFEPGKPYFVLTWLQLKPDGTRSTKTIPINVHYRGYKVTTKYFPNPVDIINWFKQSHAQSHQKSAMIANRNSSANYFGQQDAGAARPTSRVSRFDQEAPVGSQGYRSAGYAAPAVVGMNNYGNYGNGNTYNNGGAYGSAAPPPPVPPRRR